MFNLILVPEESDVQLRFVEQVRRGQRAQHKIEGIGHSCATISADAQGKESLTQSTKEDLFRRLRGSLGKKTNNTDNSCS